MKSKIRVEFDFDTREPYIQLYLEKDLEEQPDLRDQMLKAFIQEANYKGMHILYPKHNDDNSVPQIRLGDGKPLELSFENYGKITCSTIVSN